MSGAHVWRAEPHEADRVAALLVALRDHIGADWPSENSFLASVERLVDDPATEYLLGAPGPGDAAAGVVQLRYRWSVWRASEDCLLEDLFVAPDARRRSLRRALLHAAVERARERGQPAHRARHRPAQRGGDEPLSLLRLQRRGLRRRPRGLSAPLARRLGSPSVTRRTFSLHP